MTDDERTTAAVEPASGAVEVDSYDTVEGNDDDTVEGSDTDAAVLDAAPGRLGPDWARILAYGILPGLLLVLCLAAGYLKYVDESVRVDDEVRIESVQAARDSTIALLSYTPDKVEQQLGDAQNLLTGEFRDSYTSLTKDVVIPGAKQQSISATATVPDAASVVAESNRAVVLVFVNQTTVIGTGAPTNTASTVRVTLEKSGDRWLISAFDPV